MKIYEIQYNHSIDFRHERGVLAFSSVYSVGGGWLSSWKGGRRWELTDAFLLVHGGVGYSVCMIMMSSHLCSHVCGWMDRPTDGSICTRDEIVFIDRISCLDLLRRALLL